MPLAAFSGATGCIRCGFRCCFLGVLGRGGGLLACARLQRICAGAFFLCTPLSDQSSIRLVGINTGNGRKSHGVYRWYRCIPCRCYHFIVRTVQENVIHPYPENPNRGNAWQSKQLRPHLRFHSRWLSPWGMPPGLTEIIAMAMRQEAQLMRGCFVAGDVQTLRRAAGLVTPPGCPALPIAVIMAPEQAQNLPPGCIGVLQVGDPLPLVPWGKVNKQAGAFAGQCVLWAADAALRGHISALVTAPTAQGSLVGGRCALRRIPWAHGNVAVPGRPASGRNGA